MEWVFGLRMHSVHLKHDGVIPLSCFLVCQETEVCFFSLFLYPVSSQPGFLFQPTSTVFIALYNSLSLEFSYVYSPGIQAYMHFLCAAMQTTALP